MQKESKFQPVIPMLQVYVRDYKERNDLSNHALRLEVGFGGGKVLNNLLVIGKSKIETIEAFLEHFGITYPDLEAWYNAKK